MNKNLIVEIFVPVIGTDCRKGEIATGYPVGKNLILTARHPLYPKGASRDKACKIEVRWACHPKVDNTCWWPVDKIVWEGEDECDVALLSCKIPAGIHERGTLSTRKPRSHSNWESHGFPLIGGSKNDRPKPFPMKGSVFSMADTESTFHVSTDDGPNDRKKWEGASGSPIITDDGIIGILVSVPDDLNAKRFKAVPTWKLLKNEAFSELVSHAAPNRELQQEIALALRDADVTMDALQETLPDAGFPNREYPERNERFAALLLEQPLETLIEALRDAHRTLCVRRQQAAAEIVAEVSHAVLPAVFDSAAVEVVRLQRFDSNEVLLEIDAATRTVAEIVMARAEPRKTRFKPVSAPGEAAMPAYALPYPPTCGMDPQFQFATHSIEIHLEEKLGVEFIRAEDASYLSDDHRRKMIADRLRRESKERRTRYVAFKFANADDRQEALAGLATLKNRYPELVLLDLSTDPELLVEQRALFEPFELIINPPEDDR